MGILNLTAVVVNKHGEMKPRKPKRNQRYVPHKSSVTKNGGDYSTIKIITKFFCKTDYIFCNLLPVLFVARKESHYKLTQSAL